MQGKQERKQKTENNINNCAAKELSEIMGKIDKAIANGEFLFSTNGYLQPETKQRLEELGYKVETGSQYNESYYSVSWERRKNELL